jgi:hypothetical protein
MQYFIGGVTRRFHDVMGRWRNGDISHCVVSPLLAVGAVVMAIVSYTQGRGVVRWAITAVGLLMISGLDAAD